MITKFQAINNLDNIITQIEKARLLKSYHHIVSLVAVSKYNTTDDIKILYSIGQRAFGENKVQDLKTKSNILKDLPIEWHFIGKLQTNKINMLIDTNLSLFHSLNSFVLAEELDKRLKNKNKILNCLLQINISQEKNKNGVNPKEAIDLYHQISKKFANIKLLGIMAMGSNTTDMMKIKENFDIINHIFKHCLGAKICSMGMSGDFETAIKSGSNMVRIGSKLFKKD